MTTGRTRFLLEILFLIAVAGASAAFHWGPGAVAAAMGGAFVLVVAVEISTLRTERTQRPAQPQVQAPSAPAPPPPREETWVEALERLRRRAAPEPSRTAQAEAPTRRLTLPTRREEPQAPPARPAPRPAPTPELGPRAPQLRPPRRSESRSLPYERRPLPRASRSRKPHRASPRRRPRCRCSLGCLRSPPPPSRRSSRHVLQPRCLSRLPRSRSLPRLQPPLPRQSPSPRS